MGRYRKFDEDFKQGAVSLVTETGKLLAQVARELGMNEGTLGNWVAKARGAVGEGNGEVSETERAELARLRRRSSSCGCSVMCSSVRWPSGWTRRWAGDGGHLHRCPEGRPSGPARDIMPRAGGVRAVVLQVVPR